MVILVDMDDVLEQLVEAIVKYNNMHYGTDVRSYDVVEWNLARAFPTLSREQVYSPEYDESFWATVEPMPGADMERQLAATSRLLSQKAIDGVIFHCTPLVDMNLDAVNVSRAWIRENASRKHGT